MRFVILVLAVLVAAASARAEGKRVAVVVGVGAYQAVPQLANPPRDARAIADALRRLGFDTTLVLDPDRAGLEKAIRTLGERGQDAEAVMFFYAGHAVEANGHNVLVPVSARIAKPRDLPFETVDLDLVLDQVDDQARTLLIFLDACRDNPFQRSLAGSGRGLSAARGLAAPDADVAGTLIAFATAPGHTASDGTGADSPFTTALLRHIETPGLEVRQMLEQVRKDVRLATNGQQIPWDSSALEREFYFRPLAGPPAGGAGATAPGAAGAATVATATASGRRCHVPHVTGHMRDGGAQGTMQVANDGGGCGFSLWRRLADHVPYDTLAVTTPPRHGTVRIEDQHRVIYVPAAGYTGADLFAVTSTPKGIVTMQVTVTAASPP